jgi:hypothetical protein
MDLVMVYSLVRKLRILECEAPPKGKAGAPHSRIAADFTGWEQDNELAEPYFLPTDL